MFCHLNVPPEILWPFRIYGTNVNAERVPFPKHSAFISTMNNGKKRIKVGAEYGVGLSEKYGAITLDYNLEGAPTGCCRLDDIKRGGGSVPVPFAKMSLS